MNKRNPGTLAWKPYEAPAAIMALVSADVGWRPSDKSTQEKNEAVELTFVKAEYGILDLLNRQVLSTFDSIPIFIATLLPICSLPNLGPGNLDHSTLAQMIGALQTMCLDPSDFHGYDLFSEVDSRMKRLRRTSPALGPLALALCNSHKPVGKRRIHSLGFESCQGPFCMEKAGINIMALTCMTKTNNIKAGERLGEIYDE